MYNSTLCTGIENGCVDETGHPDQGKHLWTWCLRAPLFTVFHIAASRGSDVLLKVLGQEFDGLLGCDYFSAYRKYMKNSNVLVQFCLAHLIRDVKFLVEHPEADNRRYGTLLLNHLRELFGIIHDRAYYTSEVGFRLVLAEQRDRLVAAALRNLPDTREAQTWPSALPSTRTATSVSSQNPTWTPPTTWRNRPFASWPSTGV